MTILSALFFTLLALAVAAYFVGLLRPQHPNHDEHEDL